MSAVVSFDNVSFSYGRNRVLENIGFSVEEKDFTAIIGPNGGGKTTLLKLMLGLIIPEKGSVKVFGKEPSKNILKTGYVPQFSIHDSTFPVTVEEVVMHGLLTSGSLGPFYNRRVKKKVIDVLEKLGISNRAKEKFGALSGGLKQRTLIARAVVSNPELLLLDEPVSSVDSSVEKDVFEMLDEFNENMTIVIVSHDIGFVSRYVNKIACVNKTLVINDAQDITLKDIDGYYKSGQVVINHKCGI